jgi:hypothetical protein
MVNSAVFEPTPPRGRKHRRIESAMFITTGPRAEPGHVRNHDVAFVVQGVTQTALANQKAPFAPLF